MLENLSIQRYSPSKARDNCRSNEINVQLSDIEGSDNPIGAGNQQERPLPRMFNINQVSDSVGYYIAGFVDGKGSFHLSFQRCQHHKLPWKVSLCLHVFQSDKVILAWLKKQLGCGIIRNKGGGVWMYEVNNLRSIRSNVIPFFERFGFISATKKREFAVFQQAAEMMSEEAHLSKEGVVDLISLRRRMNDGGKWKYSEEQILGAFDALESSETIRRTTPNSE